MLKDVRIVPINKNHKDWPLKYQVSYKLVSNTPWFNQEKYRNTIGQVLTQLAVSYSVYIDHVQVYDYGVVFDLSTDLMCDLHLVVNRLALRLAQTLNKLYPELNLKAYTVGSHHWMSAIWHHPYYVRSLETKSKLDQYLK